MNYLLAFTALVAAGTSITTILLLVRQLRLSRELSQRSSQYNFLDSSKSRVLEIDVNQAIRRLGMDSISLRLNRPLTSDEAERVADDPDGHYAMNYLLNELENLCVSREFGLVSGDVFDRIHKSRISWWGKFLKAYILVMRSRLGDAALWQGVYERGLTVVLAEPLHGVDPTAGPPPTA